MPSSMQKPPTKGFWANMRAYTVSLLKAWWGDAATADNDFCFDYLPRLTGRPQHVRDRRWLRSTARVKGYFLLGENPAVGSANGKLQRLGMAKLDWLVVRDFSLIESATWWKDGPEIETGELRTRGHRDRGLLPAGGRAHREGRQLHQHPAHAAVAPPGGRARRRLRAASCGSSTTSGRLIREKLAGSTDDMDRPMLDLTWDYPTEGRERRAGRGGGACARSTAGDADGKPLAAYTELKDDGSTACGCWIYCGVYADGVNQAARRKPGTRAGLGRAGVGLGLAREPPHPVQPRVGRSGRQALERAQGAWSGGTRTGGKWTGHDVPDFMPDKAPDYRPPPDASGPDALAGADPFIMQADGKAWLFAPAGLTDGPLPTHYEPQESPFRNLLYGAAAQPGRARSFRRASRQPHATRGRRPGCGRVSVRRDDVPTTEHHTAGGMSRWLPYLAELQPEIFCEVSPELAAERGLEHLGWATIVTARNAIEARVLVTDRMPSAHRAGPPDAPGRPAVPLGSAATAPATRQRAWSRSAWTRTCTSRRSRRSPATSARPPAARPGARLIRRGVPAAGRHTEDTGMER